MPGKIGEFRCSGCNKLLAKATVKEGKVEIKCSCKTVNVIEVKATPKRNVPYQERMGLEKKVDDSLSFKITHLPE